MDTHIRPRSDTFADRCAECVLRPTWKGNLITLLVVAAVLVLIFS